MSNLLPRDLPDAPNYIGGYQLMAEWLDIVINFEKEPGISATNCPRPQACIASILATIVLDKARQYLHAA